MDLPTAKPIHQDYAATTPVHPRAVQQMLPFLCEHFGNPASHSHTYGWTTAEAVETASDPVAALNGAAPRELTWASGATESNNLATLPVDLMSLSAHKSYRPKGSLEPSYVLRALGPVSYTHLDVYKRQAQARGRNPEDGVR